MADKKPQAKAAREIFGLELGSWVRSALGGKASKAAKATAGKGGRGKAGGASASGAGLLGRVVYVGAGGDLSQALSALGDVELLDWQRERLARRRGEVLQLAGRHGPVWVATPGAGRQGAGAHGGLLEMSPFAQARDLLAVVATQAQDHALSELTLSHVAASDEEQLGALVGLELGAYRFRQVRQPATLVNQRPPLTVDGIAGDIVERAAALGVATNLARHLVNLPPSLLQPESYAAAVVELFAGSPSVDVEVWSGKRLEKERMGLLIAVGRGAAHGPHLVKISYRPKGKTRLAKPIAVVGKGVTFDTGGLDLKDAASMRMMKKDMGGSASVLALAFWAQEVGVDLALDFYLALAENAIGKDAFKPGDILTARSGQTVEIDNTDAEGRLVLADAIDVALSATGKDAPGLLIDLATLTGAMRVGLGTRLGGLFASDDTVAEELLQAGKKRGDPMWRMPLYAEYGSGLKSTVADVANSGPSRFGGAITAALFLGRFVGGVKWAHVDMYGWTEGGHGGYAEPGGNGQCVQAIAEYFLNVTG